MATTPPIAEPPTAEPTTAKPGLLDGITRWYFYSFLTHFLAFMPLSLTILLCAAMLTNALGESYGVDKLVWHDDWLKQMFVGAIRFQRNLRIDCSSAKKQWTVTAEVFWPKGVSKGDKRFVLPERDRRPPVVLWKKSTEKTNKTSDK